jgi:pimeloyl-ACP methyl ester carboxylesterase
MPDLSRPDGARIHYDVRGEGEPAILLASYWSWVPDTYDDLLTELAADHRVATYHLRGNGDSSRKGPFDMKTDAADLEAMIEEVGGPAVVIATADSSNRAVDVAARRGDLIAAVVCFGAAPFALSQFEGSEGMVSSETVVGAFIEMLESNYRGAMRTFMESTNPQMSDIERRDRVAFQAEFCGAQAAVERLRSWVDDDPSEAARALGERLWVFAAGDVAGAWLPPGPEVARITRETLPQAKVIDLEPGPVSNPSGTAEEIRRIASTARG